MLEGPLIEANILPRVGSYHWPMHLWIETIDTLKYKPFHFEKFLLKHPYFPEIYKLGGIKNK
jgi:hypothetical protein